MEMAELKHRWTRSDLARTPEGDGNKYEIIGGELLVTPAPRSRHAQLVHYLGEALRRLTDRNRIGQVLCANPALVLEDNEVQPDILVSPYVSAPPPEWEDYPSPLLVVEVLSPSTRRVDRLTKRRLYLEAGIEYWIVDGDDRTITVVRRDNPDEVMDGLLLWQPPGTSKPMELDVAEVFRLALGGVH